MGKYASEVVKLAKSWRGKNEADGSHKEIIDIYNRHTPRPRGYKGKYTDSWCAMTTSALAIELGYTDIIPIECSCYYLIEKAKQMGIWVEADNHIPKEGEFTLYDWDDNGKGDDMGAPEHIGTVTEVNVAEGWFIVTEGNYKNAVKDRKMNINGRYIRGFICPKYDVEPTKTETKVETKAETKTGVYKLTTLKRGSKGNDVTIFETIMKKMGYYTGAIDTSFGSGCVSACNKFQTKYPECGTDGKPDGTWGKKCWKKALSLLDV